MRYNHILIKKNGEETIQEQDLAHIYRDTTLTQKDKQVRRKGWEAAKRFLKQTKKCSLSQNNMTYSFFSSLCPPEPSVEHSKTRRESRLHPLEKKERWYVKAGRQYDSPNHTRVGMTPHSQCFSFLSGHATRPLGILLYLATTRWHSSLLIFTLPLGSLVQPKSSIIISIPILSLITHQEP